MIREWIWSTSPNYYDWISVFQAWHNIVLVPPPPPEKQEKEKGGGAPTKERKKQQQASHGLPLNLSSDLFKGSLLDGSGSSLVLRGWMEGSRPSPGTKGMPRRAHSFYAIYQCLYASFPWYHSQQWGCICLPPLFFLKGGSILRMRSKCLLITEKAEGVKSVTALQPSSPKSQFWFNEAHSSRFPLWADRDLLAC